MPEFPSAVISHSTLNYLGNEDELRHIPHIQHLFPLKLTPYGFIHRAHHGHRPCEGCGPESVFRGLTGVVQYLFLGVLRNVKSKDRTQDVCGKVALNTKTRMC